MTERIKSSDPQIHLENIKVQEQIILDKLHEREREIRILLSELKALRNIKKQATDQIEEQSEYELEEDILQRKRQREKEEQKASEETQSIDKLISDVQTAKVEETNTQSPYASNPRIQSIYNLPGEEVSIASDSRTIDELYALIDNPNPSKQDKDRLLEITNAVVRSRPYELNDIVSGAVDNTYAALKTVLDKRPDLISDYTPSTATSPVNEFLVNLKKNPMNDYKL